MPRYIVYGAGAIGGVIGACLYEQGHDVVLITRGAHLQAILDKGLQFDSASGSRTLSITAVDHPSKLHITTDDVVLLCMKSHDTNAAVQDLRATAPSDVPVVCMQNGIENELTVLRSFANVYGAMVICAADFVSPGIVGSRASSKIGVLAIGRFPSGTDAVADELAKHLEAAGCQAESTSEIMRYKNAKLIDNLPNATQVVFGLQGRGGEVATLVRDEGMAVLDAAGMDYLSRETVNALRANALLSGSDGLNRGTSTWQSIVRGLGSVETDYLNGEIVLLGRLHGVPTPANELLRQLTNQIARTGMQDDPMTEAEFLARIGR